MGKTVSVIIPAYNAEQHLGRMLDSINNQTYHDIECIVVNDGSIDGTRKILEQYKEKFDKNKKILKIFEQENKGQASAINLGLKQVTGEYFIWADADDFFELDAFETMVNSLEVNKNIDFIRCNAIVRLENDVEKVHSIRKQKDFNQQNILDDYIQYREEKIPTYIGIIMTRFEYFKKKNKGLDINENRVGQNLQLIIPITYKAKGLCLDKEVYNYVIRMDSHSRAKRTKKEKIKRMYNARNLRIETINKVMEEEDIKKYSKIINRMFYKRILKEIFINDFIILKNKMQRYIKNTVFNEKEK